MSTLIHHESIVARQAPNGGEDGQGVFDVIETDDCFAVIDSNGSPYLSTHGTLNQAVKAATHEAVEFDRKAREEAREADARETRATIARKRTVRDRDIELRDLRGRFHRNGISGEGFTALSFRARIRGAGRAFRPMIATLFDGPGQCAVVEPANISNCWRGDDFEPLLRLAAQAFDESGELYDSTGQTNL